MFASIKVTFISKYAFSPPLETQFTESIALKIMKLYRKEYVPHPAAEVSWYRLLRSVIVQMQSSLIYTAQRSLDPPIDISIKEIKY